MFALGMVYNHRKHPATIGSCRSHTYPIRFWAMSTGWAKGRRRAQKKHTQTPTDGIHMYTDTPRNTLANTSALAIGGH
jgi:hypothetical protein